MKDIENSLNSLEFDNIITGFQNLIEKTLEKNKKQLDCDKNCQFDKKVALLTNNLENAKISSRNGQKNIDLAEKSLIEFREGKEKYKKHLLNKYKNEIAIKSKNIIKDHNDITDNLKKLIYDYSNEINNQKNIDELIIIKTDINNKNNKKINDDLFETSTSERKYFYENKEYNSLINARYYLIRLYYLIIVFYFIYLCTQGSYKKYQFWIFMIFLFILPFFVGYTSELIIYIYKFIKNIIFSILNIIPHNVYFNI